MTALATTSAPPAIDAPAPRESDAPKSDAPARNTVFLELLGSGLLYSVNYERLVPEWNLGLRAGAGYFAWGISRAEGSGALHLAGFPVVASWYVGPTHHKLQLGLGATLLYVSASADATGTQFKSDVDGWGIAASAVIGYRYVPIGSGVTFGVGFTPLLRASKGLLPWGGASVGYSF